MKQYWSFFKSGKFAFLALFFVSLTVISCDNDDDNNVSPDPPIEKGEIELAENAQALNYFDLAIIYYFTQQNKSATAVIVVVVTNILI